MFIKISKKKWLFWKKKLESALKYIIILGTINNSILCDEQKYIM